MVMFSRSNIEILNKHFVDEVVSMIHLVGLNDVNSYFLDSDRYLSSLQWYNMYKLFRPGIRFYSSQFVFKRIRRTSKGGLWCYKGIKVNSI